MPPVVAHIETGRRILFVNHDCEQNNGSRHDPYKGGFLQRSAIRFLFVCVGWRMPGSARPSEAMLEPRVPAPPGVDQPSIETTFNCALTVNFVHLRSQQ
jgi:hypothetical protein